MPNKNPVLALASVKAWRAANPEKAAQYTRNWRAANKERVAAVAKARNQANKVHIAATYKAWCTANPEKVRAKAAYRRARKLNATPPWQSREELDAIWIACPEGHHVDHIYPLAGKMSCGLNVPWNLQYLPAHENMAKGNRMPTDKELTQWLR